MLQPLFNAHGHLANGLIEPLVIRIEGRDGNVDDFHFTDRAMADIGWDENGSHRANGDEFAIEFHVAFAFEDQVDLGELFVVMGFRVGGDVNEVYGGSLVFGGCEGSPGGSAWAFGWLDFVEVGYDSFLHEERVVDLFQVFQYDLRKIFGDSGDFGDFCCRGFTDAS